MPRKSNVSFLNSINNEQVIICLLLVILVVLVVYYVHQNNRESFNESSPTLYFFFVDWCPHCTNAKPKIEDLKKELQNNKVKGKNVVVRSVNCEEEKDLAKQFNVRAYPSLVLVNGEEKTEYDAGVSVDGLKSFLEANL